MTFVVLFSPVDGRWVSSPNPKKKTLGQLSVLGAGLTRGRFDMKFDGHVSPDNEAVKKFMMKNIPR